MRVYKFLYQIGLLLLTFSGCQPTFTSDSTALPPSPTPKRSPQHTSAPAGTWQTYTQADGLPYPSTTSIEVDKTGKVWVGTARGAAVFDGSNWTQFTTQNGLLSNLVLSLAVDPNNTVWFGGDKGVTRYDGRDWTHYTDEDPLPTGFVQEIATGLSGEVWFGLTGAGDDWAFGNGAARLYDGGSPGKEDDEWQIIHPSRQTLGGDLVSAIADLGTSGIWFGTTPEGTVRATRPGGGVWRVAGLDTQDTGDDTWSFAHLQDGLIGKAVTVIEIAEDGSMWLGTTEGLMHLAEESHSRFNFSEAETYTLESGLPSNLILSLAEGPSGEIWVGTDSGLAAIKDGETTIYTKDDGLAANQIRAIAIGPDGAVWVATPSGVSVRH